MPPKHEAATEPREPCSGLPAPRQVQADRESCILKRSVPLIVMTAPSATPVKIEP